MTKHELFAVFVAGGIGTGKTTFIRQISEIEVVSTQRDHPPTPNYDEIAFDFGRLRADNETAIVYFFGEPGCRRMTFSVYQSVDFFAQQQKKAVVILLDATIHNSNSSDAKELIPDLREAKIPFLVAINRADDPDALSLDKFKHLWGITEDDVVMHCNVLDRVEVCDTVLKLFEQLPEEPAKQQIITKIQEIRCQSDPL